MATERRISMPPPDIDYLRSYTQRVLDLFEDQTSADGRRLNLLDRLGRSLDFPIGPEELLQNVSDCFHDVLTMAGDQKSDYQTAATAALMGLPDPVEHELRILDQLESADGYAMQGIANLVRPLIFGATTSNGRRPGLKNTKDGIDNLGKAITMKVSARAS